jgi:predicted nucleotidyltransferase
MSGSLSYLSSNELAAVEECTRRMVSSLQGELCHLWLFGSKTRGDFGPDSDIDLLVVVRNLQRDIRRQIRHIGADCSLEYDVLFNTHILTLPQWDYLERHQGTLWSEIQRDGVALMEVLPV